MKQKAMVKKKTWEEFRKTGLVLIINQILHIFGWAITFNLDDKGKILEVYPSRVRFRGFAGQCVDDAYLKVQEYLEKNIDVLGNDVRNK